MNKIHDPLIIVQTKSDVTTNFAVITNVVIKGVHCIRQRWRDTFFQGKQIEFTCLLPFSIWAKLFPLSVDQILEEPFSSGRANRRQKSCFSF